MLNLSEIHPDVRKTLHEMENALVRDVSPNTGQANIGKAIKDTYAKSSWVRMYSPIDSTLEYVYYTEADIETLPDGKNIGDIKVGEDGTTLETRDSPRGGMDTVCIMGGELMKEGEGADTTFKHLSGFRDIYDRSLFDKENAGYVTPEGDRVMYREDRFRPLPGITSVSVEFAGSTKAIRNATINWVCHSYTDIGRLTPHFLGHGKPVVLEWGWSSVDDFSDVTFFSKEDIKDGSAYEEIQDMIWKNEGKYDAMAGLIKNFEWKTRDDGGFDCITEITSLGVNTLGQQTKSEIAPTADGTESRKAAEFEEDSEEEEIKETQGNYAPTLEQFVEQLNDEISGLCQTPGKIFGNLWTTPVVHTDQPKGILKAILRSGSNVEAGPYVSWGWMEDNIVSKFLGKVNTNGKLLSTFRSIVPVMEGGKPKLEDGKWMWESVKISNHKHLMTSNPNRFIFLGQWFDESNMDSDWGYDTERTIELKQQLEEAGDGKSFENFADPNDSSIGYLRNIIIHWEVISEAFTGVTSVESGMQNIFNKLNEEYGIWKFKITDATFPSEMHGVGRVMVVDENYSENKVVDLLSSGPNGISKLVGEKVEGKLFVFNVMNEKSLVKGHSLTAKLPSSMQTAAMFGANSKGKAPSVAGNPSSMRYGKSIGKNPNTSLGDMKMAWEYPTFGYGDDRTSFTDAQIGLSVTGGPELMVTKVLTKEEKSDIEKDPTGKDAREKALKAEKQRQEQEKMFMTNVEKLRKNEKLDLGDSNNEKKMYDEWGALKTDGTYKWNNIMRSVITTGPEGSLTTRPLLIPLEIEIQLTGIGGIVPGNAFTTNYLPPEYHGWVAFQAIDISHSIGTDGWVTTLRGLMRMAENPPKEIGEPIKKTASTSSPVVKTSEVTEPNSRDVKEEEVVTLEEEVDTANTETEILEGEEDLERKPRADYVPAGSPLKRPAIAVPSEEEN